MTHAVLKSGEKIEADMVLVGVGARPNTELFKGQLDLLEERPGGIKVRALYGFQLSGLLHAARASCGQPSSCACPCVFWVHNKGCLLSYPAKCASCVPP